MCLLHDSLRWNSVACGRGHLSAGPGLSTPSNSPSSSEKKPQPPRYSLHPLPSCSSGRGSSRPCFSLPGAIQAPGFLMMKQLFPVPFSAPLSSPWAVEGVSYLHALTAFIIHVLIISAFILPWIYRWWAALRIALLSRRGNQMKMIVALCTKRQGEGQAILPQRAAWWSFSVSSASPCSVCAHVSEPFAFVLSSRWYQWDAAYICPCGSDGVFPAVFPPTSASSTPCPRLA